MMIPDISVTPTPAIQKAPPLERLVHDSKFSTIPYSGPGFRETPIALNPGIPPDNR